MTFFIYYIMKSFLEDKYKFTLSSFVMAIQCENVE